MLATAMNCLAVCDVFKQIGAKARVMTAVDIQGVGERYDTRRSIEYLEAGKIVLDGPAKVDIFEDCLHSYSDRTGRRRPFPLNRMVLLITAVASFVLPLCVFTFHHTVVMTVPVASIAVERPLAAIVEPSRPWWQTGAVVIFFMGVSIVVCHVVWSVIQIGRAHV